MHEGYARVFSEHHVALVRGCTLAAGGNQAAAEDAVAEAFIRSYPAWKRGRIHNEAAFLRVAALNELRRVAKRTRLEILGEGRPTASLRSGDATEINSVDDRSQIESLMAGLNLREREVLVLRFYFDHREEDVARELGMPLGTVKSLCHRGLHRLRSTGTIGVQDAW